jgi:NADH-quinone oxidoreductase subunit N
LRVSYLVIAPEIVVTGAACLVLLLDLVLRGPLRVYSGYIAGIAVAIAGIFALANWGTAPRTTLGGMFALDQFAVVLKLFFLAVALFVVWLALPPLRGHRYEGEFYFLFLCSVLGTLLMPSSRDLLMLFVSLELVSAPAFVMAGLRKLNPRSNEASLKFFLFGVLSAGVLVYGISLVYGAAGTTNLSRIAGAVAASTGRPKPLLLIGIVFVVAAFGFKISAVPFHFWAPDTYEGSPTPLAAYLSVASKAAGFVGLLLILAVGFAGLQRYWGPVVGGIAIATMTVGNVVALRQRHLIRLLAYSSIAHAGYMLIPVALIRPHGGQLGATNATLIRSLIVYLIVYAFMNLGAFAVAVGASKQYPTLLVRDLTGLGRRAPLAALAMAAFLISLAGIPPFLGWFGKFVIFLAAIRVGSVLGVVLAVMMVVNSVVSLYYYVGVVRAMYLQDSEDTGAVSFPAPITAAVAAAMAGVTVLGVYPEPVVRLAAAARLAVRL